MLRRRCRVALTAVLILFLSPPVAQADFAVADLGTNVFTTGAVNQLWGWEFTPTATITITKLGFFDYQSDGLATSHQVGIFDGSTQHLLVSGTVGAGTTAPIEGPAVHIFGNPAISLGAFRYIDVTPITLNPGQLYVIAGTNKSTAFDAQADTNPNAPASLESSPFIVIGQGRDIFFGPEQLAFPTNVIGAPEFGPTFQFGPTAVPEPASLSLFGIGAAGLVGYAWRRRKAKP
jgi:hypothetical protein